MPITLSIVIGLVFGIVVGIAIGIVSEEKACSQCPHAKDCPMNECHRYDIRRDGF